MLVFIAFLSEIDPWKSPLADSRTTVLRPEQHLSGMLMGKIAATFVQWRSMTGQQPRSSHLPHVLRREFEGVNVGPLNSPGKY
jgi:hypothetical protein